MHYTRAMETETSTADSQPCLQLTAEALAEAGRLRSKETDPDSKALRVYVEQGGCSGMQYGLTFDEPRDGDERQEVEGLPVVVDRFSAQYLRGAVVDFSDGLNESGFKVTNPNAKITCGCGKSFEG